MTPYRLGRLRERLKVLCRRVDELKTPGPLGELHRDRGSVAWCGRSGVKFAGPRHADCIECCEAEIAWVIQRLKELGE